MPRPSVICLTPILNEAWILQRFLQCASLWADHIIVADQNSTDGSREIAKKFSKVTLLENPSKKFNEPERQQMLIAEARKIPGPRLLLALDADEFLTSSFLTSPEWQMILHAPPGTSISFQWPMVRKDGAEFNYFLLLKELMIGFVDDGSEHRGDIIHSTRVPRSPGGSTLQLKDIGLMHYCMMDRDRFDSRLRWYQCWELLNARKRPYELYRFYHTDLFVPPNRIKPVPTEWIQGYEQSGIDMTTVNRQGHYRWDKEVLQFFDEHGTEKFRRLAIWDTDWSRLYSELYPDKRGELFSDPRSRFDKLVHRWLRGTQRYYCFHAKANYAQRLYHRSVRKALRPLGW
jgi:glycosyltransferase involved in cell wall biosynthesis